MTTQIKKKMHTKLFNIRGEKTCKGAGGVGYTPPPLPEAALSKGGSPSGIRNILRNPRINFPLVVPPRPPSLPPRPVTYPQNTRLEAKKIDTISFLQFNKFTIIFHN